MRRAPQSPPPRRRACISNCCCFGAHRPTEVKRFPSFPDRICLFYAVCTSQRRPDSSSAPFSIKDWCHRDISSCKGVIHSSLHPEAGWVGGCILIFPIPPPPPPPTFGFLDACNFRVISVCHHPAAPAPPAQISHALHRPICVSRVELDLTSS